MALLSNGTVIAWGDNWLRQINTPASLTNATFALAAGYHTTSPFAPTAPSLLGN